MKKLFTILGVVFLAILVVAAGFVGYAAYTGSKFDASSKAYVDDNIPKIVSTWSKDELLKRASPELRKVASDDDIDRLFTKLNELGSLQKYEGAKGDSNISFTSQNGKVVTAAYTAKATFQNGSAEIQIRLIQHDGAWSILNFHVNSPIFLK